MSRFLWALAGLAIYLCCPWLFLFFAEDKARELSGRLHDAERDVSDLKARLSARIDDLLAFRARMMTAERLLEEAFPLVRRIAVFTRTGHLLKTVPMPDDVIETAKKLVSDVDTYQATKLPRGLQ